MSGGYFLKGLTTFPLSLTSVSNGEVQVVDGDVSASGTGSVLEPVKTIQEAVNNISAGGTIYVKKRNEAAAATDPVNYAETIIIPATKPNISIIGIGDGAVQGGLPQIKMGSGSAALLTVRAPGCTIANLGFNGGSSTGGGILLDDDGGTSKTAFGTTIVGCHFKNCTPSTATDSASGGAIKMNSPWQVTVRGCHFYKNVGGITVLATYSDPQDIVIEDNIFAGTAATTDTYIYCVGSGTGIVIKGNYFASVLPALSSGVNARYVDLTGSTGIFANNYVAGSYTTTGFGAAKAAAKIPTTVGIAHNYSDAGLIVREA